MMSSTELLDCNDVLLSAGLNSCDTYEIIEQDNIGSMDLESYEKRFLTALTVLLANSGDKIDKDSVQSLIDKIDEVISSQVDEVLKDESFMNLERNWRSVYELASSIDNNKTKLSIIDVTKEELSEDFEINSADIISSDLFQKVYVSEYDQYGGEPFGSIIGLYSYSNTPEDIEWLNTMGKVAEASHAPFISAVSPNFFGENSFSNLSEIKDIEGLMSQPKYGRWNAFRKTRSAGYVGLTLPNFMLRIPYNPETNPVGKGVIPNFTEKLDMVEPQKSCLWGNAAVLFAKNLFRSYEITGWCQSICGPTSGGLVEGLPIYNYNHKDPNAFILPTNFLMPDHKEYALAKAGFISLVYEKKTSNATFFSAQSLKVSEEFEDDNDSENSQMVTKLPYTFSISKIAHYIKCYTRDVIGSEMDENNLNDKLSTWLNRYVTDLPNPSTLTRQYYPFKAAAVEVMKSRGMAGFYNCNITVLPHIKFEGMDVVMKIDTRLGN
ncbi:type VI secretion system contractile sheath large subunit [Francisella adeliensis]|uniref:Intracellular growth locus iglB n=1 Tax=Francisella adeliensis TaxID=2007306 RepID=A0A2Z4Y0J4_9GAMM|nr:type VI secretion system contractile sheath large subunit [Francisella adeliensis]AXA34584.1 intracellular growth locus iglB [Francisella adeliensis]MBK2086308.1 type VI secretion system contractile sheath large subunit [Francisella adeliensis]MBK2096524.1 type VI secretion system contractile sheath large subunit [Francisella adeliensis]QIW12829.1 type VI secretion system contractile sheath large subunit [Francisella adeliensis]QIW14706.1 type VI secretion system contractile sheath large su